jgi:hypothetical protein
MRSTILLAEVSSTGSGERFAVPTEGGVSTVDR